MQRCITCKGLKYLDEFYENKNLKSGFASECKKCTKERTEKWRINNLDKHRESNRIWANKNRDRNIEKIKKAQKKWRQNPNNFERIKEDMKEWNEKNPQKLKEYWRKNNEKRNADPIYKISKNMSAGIRNSLKGNKNGYHWEDLVDYDQEILREYLEKQFKYGMTWGNYGRNGWHIDHIIPVSIFNIKGIESKGFKECWKLENLQPLWEKDNIKKSNRIFY